MKSITLTQGYYALVDDEDFERVNKFNWYVNIVRRNIYAQRKEGFPVRKTILMHRFILNAPKGLEVDHINSDGLDNRKENLRLCTTAQNQQHRRTPNSNTTGFKGVSRQLKKYQAIIRANNSNLYLGSFSTPEEAARAYDEAAKKYYGEFAQLNFPE